MSGLTNVNFQTPSVQTMNGGQTTLSKFCDACGNNRVVNFLGSVVRGSLETITKVAVAILSAIFGTIGAGTNWVQTVAIPTMQAHPLITGGTVGLMILGAAGAVAYQVLQNQGQTNEYQGVDTTLANSSDDESSVNNE